MIVAHSVRPLGRRLHTIHTLFTPSTRSRSTMAMNLPALEPHARLSSRVIRILGGNPGKYTLQGTNTYLIGTGSTRLLIDTGEGRSAWREELQSVLDSEKCNISSVLLTHWHPDHVGGVADAMKLSPDATVHKHAGGPSGATAESTPRIDIAATVAPLRDGEQFAVEGATLRAIHAPGHTTDHTGFILQEEDNALFSGDAVLGHGTAVFEDLGEYVRGLGVLKNAVGAEARIYPAHGAVIENGRHKVQEYIDHRAQREQEIVAVLKQSSAPCTPMDIVKVVYKAYPVELHAPAEGGVRLVLAKLKAEDKVSEEGGKWRVKEGGGAAL